MDTEMDYDKEIEARAEHVFSVMEPRCTPEDMDRLRRAFELARKAHAQQKRKTGEPYILHPIAVAAIAAEELMLDANPVMAAFLHDVVEDTDYSNDDIERMFGPDVAFLVGVVTKQKRDSYRSSKQVDNYRQMLDSFQYDIRAMLIKLADRLHNMRTLSSMRPDKQMKIAGETDYFYAPLANRLGLYHVKIELENLSFRFRCPHEYSELVSLIQKDEAMQHDRLARFTEQIHTLLLSHGIETDVRVEYRAPYSIWRKMAKFGDDFNHLKYRHFTDVVFAMPGATEAEEKDMVLKIYSILTSHFKEKPGGISNYIDSPKANGYQSFHLKLLADFGRWQEVHISSERMIRDSRLGCVAHRTEDNIKKWIEKFRGVLRDLVHQPDTGGTEFIDKIVTTFYNDDIMTFTSTGTPVVMPQKATVLDFAYEISPETGQHAHYARINNFLASIKDTLRRGDVVEVFTDPAVEPAEDWLHSCVTYKARKCIQDYLDSRPRHDFTRCPKCNPIPGEEVVGFCDPDTRQITVHKRDCADAIRLASKWGDNIVSVDYEPDHTLYPETIVVTAVDRFHLFIDLVDCITNQLGLSMDAFNTSTRDCIVTCTISLGVHSVTELQSIMTHIAAIPGVDTVKRR